MLTRLRALFAAKDAIPPQEWADPQPAQPMAIVGDVHGCDDLLARLMAELDPALQLVFVGDYIDRGEASAAVIDRLRAVPGAICLRGNHEQMMLDFLARPEAAGPRWLRNGGLQTMASFGIAQVTPATKGPRLGAAAEALRAALGPQTLAWLQALPTLHRSGTVAVVHAAADPAAPMTAQDDAHLLWGHTGFLQSERTDGLWVAHGHTIVDAASATAGRIATDTGAFATGRLTAAIVGDGPVRFVST